jgi:hypothetical protein
MDDIEHPQISFVDLVGNICEVDIGMYDLLTALKKNDVLTMYSCQGNEDSDLAYVSCDRKDALKLMKKTLRLYKRKELSTSSILSVSKFILGRHISCFGLFICSKRLGRLTWTSYWEKGPKGTLPTRRNNGYWIEKDYQYPMNFRVTFRWPQSDTKKLVSLLDEVLSKSQE